MTTLTMKKEWKTLTKMVGQGSKKGRADSRLAIHTPTPSPDASCQKISTTTREDPARTSAMEIALPMAKQEVGKEKEIDEKKKKEGNLTSKEGD